MKQTKKEIKTPEGEESYCENECSSGQKKTKKGGCCGGCCG